MKSILTLLLGISLLIGCDRGSSAPDASASGAKSKVTNVVAGAGVARGKVTFSGTPPPMKEVASAHCHEGVNGAIREESVVVNDNGTLRNVFVYVKGVTADAPANAIVPLLDQQGCIYVPHVVAVQVGQPLTVRSSDPTPHNVHFTPKLNKARNLNMVSKGSEQQITFDHAEFIRFKCDVHPWMNAYVGVFPHPFFATTGPDGTFELTNLPAGTFTLVAWHERFGEIEKEVTIDSAKSVDVEFNFAP